ncbi:murein hydrolase activator EnvC [Microbacterium sp. USTB-Y]|uniref:murein hydrolase activator EnvC family protein n=1 Tax=Microbacterium sp. USTB-Y TaxID=2823692 RepID=UPI002040E4D5|nr:M23 family metallopeptidase [Microbacterium sp. USTB-Y]
MSRRRHPAPAANAPRRALAAVAVLLGALAPPLAPYSPPSAAASVAARGHPSAATDGGPVLPDQDWMWPVEGARSVMEPFRPPAHAYGPGHRGVDIAASGDLRAPAGGVVAFVGTVADRALLTIDHGNGLITTYEPATAILAPGAPVRRGDLVARASSGGHAPAGSVHVGVRWNGVYVNPMLLFGGVPRAVLLPCGADRC